MKRNKITFFLSDEGFGHAMRQKNVIKCLAYCNPSCEIDIFTKVKQSVLRDYLGSSANYIEFYNLIQTEKTIDGSLDISATKTMFENWSKSLNSWCDGVFSRIDINTKIIVSDSVPQASLIARKLKIPCIFIQHFTWDWLYQELYGKDDIFDSLNKLYKESSLMMFPPLTPVKNIHLHPNYEKLGYIVNQELVMASRSHVDNISNREILLMNNGTNSASMVIEKILQGFPVIQDVKLLVRYDILTANAKKYALQRNDVTLLQTVRETHEKLCSSNIIVARGGYNTLSEIMVLNKTALIMSEEFNPEVESNIALCKDAYKFIKCTSSDTCIPDLVQVLEQLQLRESSSFTCCGAFEAALAINQMLMN